MNSLVAPLLLNTCKNSKNHKRVVNNSKFGFQFFFRLLQFFTNTQYDIFLFANIIFSDYNTLTEKSRA